MPKELELLGVRRHVLNAVFKGQARPITCVDWLPSLTSSPPSRPNPDAVRGDQVEWVEGCRGRCCMKTARRNGGAYDIRHAVMGCLGQNQGFVTTIFSKSLALPAPTHNRLVAAADAAKPRKLVWSRPPTPSQLMTTSALPHRLYLVNISLVVLPFVDNS